MKRFKMILVLMACATLPCSTFAQTVEKKDIKSEVETHLKDQLVGKSVSDGPTVIKRHQINTPFGKKTVWEDRAKGKATITKIESFDGKVERISIPDFGINFIVAEAKIKLRYESQTSCERIANVGGTVVDKPWGSLHPKGYITASLIVKKQENGKLDVKIDVEPGNPDRPNNYVSNYLVAGKLVPELNRVLSAKLGVTID